MPAERAPVPKPNGKRSGGARRPGRDGAKRDRTRPDAASKVGFTSSDLVIASRHVADLEAAGATCRLVAGDDHSAWIVTLPSREVFTLTRRGDRIFNDVATRDGDVLPDCLGHASIDLEFRAIRLVARLDDRSFAALADDPDAPRQGGR